MKVSGGDDLRLLVMLCECARISRASIDKAMSGTGWSGFTWSRKRVEVKVAEATTLTSARNMTFIQVNEGSHYIL
jgi:hypothetical protein